MSLKLITGPAGSGKTCQALEAFSQAVSRGLEPVFVAPSRPDARHFLRSLLRRLGDQGGGDGGDGGAAGAGILSRGRFTTFDGLCRMVVDAIGSGAATITAGDRQFLLLTLIEAGRLDILGGSAGYDGFATALADLISQLETAGYGPGEMGEKLRPWTIGNRWRRGLVKDLFLLYESYRAALDHEGVRDPELFQQQALDAIAADASILPAPVIFDGFRDFTPLQHRVIEAAAAGTDVVVTLPCRDGSEAFRAPARHRLRLESLGEELCLEPGDRSETAAPLRHLGENLFRADMGSAGTGRERTESAVTSRERADAAGALELLVAAGSRGQAKAVAAEILRLWRRGETLDEIAVVFRSAGRDMEGLAAALDEFSIPCDMPVPVLLRESAPGRAALSLLAFIERGEARDLLSYLRSPLAPAPLDVVDRFDRELRLEPAAGVDELLRKWERLSGGRAEGLRGFTAAEDAESLLAGLCRHLEDLLRAEMLRDSRTPDAFEQDLLAVDRLLDIGRRLPEVLETAAWVRGEEEGDGPGTESGAAGAGKAEALRLLRVAIEAAEFRRPGLNRRGCVRLLDPHRMLNQRFDTVFICGLLEKSFPSLGREDPFFPDDERRQLADGFGLRLEDNRGRLDEERFLFHRTATRARKRLYLCYPYCDREGKPTVRSLFVDDVLELFREETVTVKGRSVSDVVFAPPAAPTPGEALRSLALLSGQDEGVDEATCRDAAEAAGLGQRLQASLEASLFRPPGLSDRRVLAKLAEMDTFSVTGLQRYLGCPFRYFVESMLDPADMEPVAYQLERGSVFHRLLCRMGELLMMTEIHLPAADPGQMKELKRKAREIVEEYFSASRTGGLERAMLKAEAGARLDRFLEREAACGRPGRYFDLEAPFGGEGGDCGGRYASEAMLNLGSFRLRGRLDRIDWLKSGGEKERNVGMVIDYKTGGVTHQDKFRERKEIQIPIYMMALRDIFGLEPIAGEYYSIRKEERGGVYLREHRALLGDCGGEVKEKDFVDREELAELMEWAGQAAADAVDRIRSGDISAEPLDENRDCLFCGFDGICRRQDRPGSGAGGGG